MYCGCMITAVHYNLPSLEALRLLYIVTLQCQKEGKSRQVIKYSLYTWVTNRNTYGS